MRSEGPTERGRHFAVKGYQKGRKADGIGFSGVLETLENGLKQWHKNYKFF
jgi:hypothetical protein